MRGIWGDDSVAKIERADSLFEFFVINLSVPGQRPMEFDLVKNRWSYGLEANICISKLYG